MAPSKPAVEFKTGPQLNNRPANEAICSALMADPGTYNAIRDIMSYTDVSITLDSKIYFILEAAWACASSKPPRDTTKANIAEHLLLTGKLDHVGLDYLETLDAAGYPSIVRAAQKNAEIVRKHARVREVLQTLQEALDEITTNPAECDITVHETQRKLQNSLVVKTEYNPSFADWEDTGDSEPPKGIATRLDFVNRKAFGLQPAKIHLITSPPKGRKTTMVRNILLDAIMNGDPISWFTVDGTRDQALRAIIAMLATYIMVKSGIPEHTQNRDGSWTHQWNISDRGLPTHMRTKEQHEALKEAYEIRKNSRLMLYDSSTGFKDLSKLELLVHRDYTRLHAQRSAELASVLVVDFVQRLRYTGKKTGWNDSDFERAASSLTDMAQFHSMTGVFISQPTQQSRTEQDPKASLYDVKINDKGGGALLEACDYQWTTLSDKADPTNVSLILLESRSAGAGRMDYKINPPSGLIVNPDAGKPESKYQTLPGYGN